MEKLKSTRIFKFIISWLLTPYNLVTYICNITGLMDYLISCDYENSAFLSLKAVEI